MDHFKNLDLPAPLAAALEKMKFVTPTPIQAGAIPPALDGRDILGSAQTGSGKTAAFGIPLIAKLMNNPQASALVLAPTRELAVQILTVMHQLIDKHAGLDSVLLIGGESMFKQLKQLKNKPRLVVGTPGRVYDHITRKTLMLRNTNFLVLDEMDRMLDMGFSIQIDQIIPHLSSVRQTLMFSATLPPTIVRVAAKYLNNPERIACGEAHVPVSQILQEIVHTQEAEKYKHLLEELEKRTGSIIVFVKTKMGADRLAHRLAHQNHSANAIHGDLHQRKRDRVIQEFRNRRYRIMVATDVAARGLDIPHIEHVINYDLPQCPEDYIHRIGRTGRAGAVGNALSLITPQDGGKWHAIHRMLNPGEPRPRREDRGPRSGGGPRRGGRQDRRPRFNKSRSGDSFGKPDGDSFGRPDKPFQKTGDSFERPSTANKAGHSFDRPGKSFGKTGDSFGKKSERPFRPKRFQKPFGKRRPSSAPSAS